MRSRRTALGVAAGCVVALSACSGNHDVSPQPIPWSADDVVNPMRGQYVWDPVTKWSVPRSGATTEPFPQSSANQTTRKDRRWPAVPTYYTRVAWSDLERSAGTLSGGFPEDSVLERRIADAASRGRRTIFRVVMTDDDSYSTTPRRMYPDYLAGAVREWRAKSSAGHVMYVPDWNSPAYVAGVERLVAELGRRYDGDPRVAGFEISGYGTWGEWNDVVWGPQLPHGYSRLTQATARRFVDAAVRAFPTTQLFAMSDPDLLRYALSRSKRIGIRFDCLGQWAGGGAFERILAVPGAKDRWLTAPIATEYCPDNYAVKDAPGVAAKNPDIAPDLLGDASGDLYANARRQVARWHVSLVSSGNFPGAGNGQDMTAQQRRDATLAAKWAGYRYRVSWAGVTPGRGGVRVATRWVNDGVAPAYSQPRIELQLRPAGTQAVATKVVSTLRLETLVAGYTDRSADAPTPAVAETSDLVPTDGVDGGRYDIVVVVKGIVSGVESTLALAQQNRTPDGGYLLTTIDL